MSVICMSNKKPDLYGQQIGLIDDTGINASGSIGTINYSTYDRSEQELFVRKMEMVTQAVMRINFYTHSKAFMDVRDDRILVEVYSRKSSIYPIFRYWITTGSDADSVIDNLNNVFHAAEVSTKKGGR